MPTIDNRSADEAAKAPAPLLAVADLSVTIGVQRVVDGVSFHVGYAETLGLVGESGCGKSITALATMGLLPKGATLAATRLDLDGSSILGHDEKRMQNLRGRVVGMIFQEPMTALNPVLTIGSQIRETIIKHERLTRAQAHARGIDLLARVGIAAPAARMADYPHQLSGGMRQRAMIAMAIACSPKLLIADEPTTALDVTIQAQILELLRMLQEEYRMGIVLITHDLGIVSSFADRVAVMYAGRIVEEASAAKLFAGPAHPYTIGLMESLPSADRQTARLKAIPGTVPPPFAWPSGCRFRPRCASAGADCAAAIPQLTEVTLAHRAACLRPVAPGAAA